MRTETSSRTNELRSLHFKDNIVYLAVKSVISFVHPLIQRIHEMQLGVMNAFVQFLFSEKLPNLQAQNPHCR